MLKLTAPLSFFRQPAQDAPAWADPRALMASCAVRVELVTLAAAVVREVAPADPKRVAIGFAPQTGIVGTTVVAPDARVDQFGWTLETFPIPPWFDIFTHGPLVNLPWYGFNGFGGAAMIFQIYRLQ